SEERVGADGAVRPGADVPAGGCGLANEASRQAADPALDEAVVLDRQGLTDRRLGAGVPSRAVPLGGYGVHEVPGPARGAQVDEAAEVRGQTGRLGQRPAPRAVPAEGRDRHVPAPDPVAVLVNVVAGLTLEPAEQVAADGQGPVERDRPPLQPLGGGVPVVV